MSNFSTSSLVKKLRDLTTSQQSVQGLSNWMIHHRKHAKVALEVWQREFTKGIVPDILYNGASVLLQLIMIVK